MEASLSKGVDCRISREFDEFTVRSYFNNASIAPLPCCSKEAVSHFIRVSSVSPSGDYDVRLRLESDLKLKIASLICAEDVNDIALIANTSSGLSKVMFGLQYGPRDEIVVLAQDFVSLRLSSAILKGRGVRVIEISSVSDRTIDEQIIAALTVHTRLVVVSSVLYASGIVVDIGKIGRECRLRGVLFCVDAIQHVGAMPFDVRESFCDFVVADGHKWMHGVEGLGFFYSHPDARHQLALNEYGWHLLDDQWSPDTDDFTISSTSRRFECGSPNYLAMSGLNASLSFLAEIGLNNIHQRLSRNVGLFAQELTESELFVIRTPSHMQGQSGILSFKSKSHDSAQLVQGLKSQGIIMVQRGNFVRFSPGFYSSSDGVKEAVRAAVDLVKMGGIG